MPSPAIAAVTAGVRRHWGILLVLSAAAVLIFTGLGRDYLWADEGDTAVLGRSILRFGVPTAWDGVTFTDSDYGQRLTDDFVMVSHPWGQYYAAAASFALLGDTAFAARLPFAMAGLITIGLVYVLLWNVSGNRGAAASAALLLTLSAQFLIFARQSRQYALNAALASLVLLLFTRLRSWRSTLIFAAGAILLFHTHPGGIALVAALGLLTLVHPPYARHRKWFWAASPIVALFTLPWLFVAGRGYTQNAVPVSTLAELWPRLGQYAVECLSVTPLIGALVLLVISRVRRRRQAATPRSQTTTTEQSLALTLLVAIAAYALVVAFTQSSQDIWVIGVRDTPAVLPFSVLLAAMAANRFGSDRPLVLAAVIVLLSVTRLGDLGPWTSWQQPTVSMNPRSSLTLHSPIRAIDRFLHTDTIAHVSEIRRSDPGTVAAVSELLATRARPGEVLITNYEWEPLYFHTNLPQGLKVLPNYPIYTAARAHGLPSYVFSADGVRWIVWRRTWGNYRGQACDELLKALVDAGIPVELVAEIPETHWENRENLHFRRFPVGRHLYGWFENVPSTLVYRVDWPAGTRQLGPR